MRDTLPSLPDANTLFQHAACGLLLCTADGTIVQANATFCGWLGYGAGELLGKKKLQDLLTIGGRVFHQTHWLPLMQENAYNLISFQHEAYIKSARLTITPEPDTLIRVFMAFKPLTAPVEIAPQALEAPARTGFTALHRRLIYFSLIALFMVQTALTWTSSTSLNSRWCHGHARTWHP